MAVNHLKWGVIESAPFTPTGRDELEAAFATKKDATEWLRKKHPKPYRRWLVVQVTPFPNWPVTPTHTERREAERSKS